MNKAFFLATKHLIVTRLVCCLFCAALSCYGQTIGNQSIATEQAIAASLSTADEEQQLSLLVNLYALLRTRPTTARPNTIAVLTNLLQTDPSPLVRTHAAHTLELAGDSTAADALLAAFKTEREMTTRKTILYALARYPLPQVTAALIPLLNHKEQEIRATAAFVLAEQADTAAAKALLHLLQKRRKDSDAFARSQAIRGLGRIGYQTAIPFLLESLQKDKAPIVRREAATALGWLTTQPLPQVIDALKTASVADDPYLREAALAAIERIRTRDSF